MTARKFIITFCLIVVAFVSYVAIALAHSGIPSSPTTSCGSIDSTDLATHAGNQIDSRILGASTSTDYKLFSTTGTNASSVWVRNASIWTNNGTDIDWTGISPYNSFGGLHRPGTLISPRHIIMATHYSITPGATITFVDNTNIAYDRTVTAVRSIGDTDISVGLLDSDVPSSVTYYPIMSQTNLEAVFKKYQPTTYDVPIVVFDQDKNTIVRSLHDIVPGSIFHHSYTSGSRSVFSQAIVGGDSGNPAFLLVDNRPVLLFAHESTSASHSYGYYISEINSAMTALGGGYQVTEYAHTCFTEYTPNHFPVFTSSTATSTLVHFSGSTPILSYTATDADAGQTLSYSLVSLSSVSSSTLSLNPSSYFSINSSTGVLSQIADLNNYTMGNQLRLVVQANDNASFVATTTSTTTINIDYPILANALSLDSVIELNYSNTLATSSVPSTSDYAVTVNGVSRSVTGVSILDKNVKLALSSAITLGDTVTVTYTPGVNKAKDNSGAFASAISSPMIIPNSNDGSLDSTFNSSNNVNNTLSKILIQSDGKIVVAGSFTTIDGSASNYIIRLLSDGSVDPTFTSLFDTVSTAPTIVSLFQQSDGKIILGGRIYSYNSVTGHDIMRLNSDGTLDNSITFLIDSNSDADEINNMVIQSDGKIVVATSGSNPAYNGVNIGSRMYRINADGTAHDSSFSAGGVGPNTTNNIKMAIQSDDKVIIAHAFTSYSGTARNRIARINTNGSLDSSFNPGTGFSVSTTSISSVVVQPDGKILVAGAFNLYNGTARNKILRLNTDGSLDTNFNTTGTGFGASTSTIASIALQPDGKIIVLGTFTSYNGITKNRIARLNSDGTLDNTFDSGNGPDVGISFSALQSDGNIVIGGSISNYNGVTRNRIARVKGATVADVAYPTVTSVTSSSANGTYKVGDTITLQVAFSEAVDVNLTGGTPSIALNNGGSAVYTSGSGSTTLNFTYTVSSGEETDDLDYNDLDYASTTALTLNGGTISDSSLNPVVYNAILTLPFIGSDNSLGKNKDIVIDGIVPELFAASVNGSELEMIYTESLNASSTISASNFTVLVNGSSVGVSSVAVSDLTVTLTLSSPVSYGQTVLVSYSVPISNSIKDTAGNEAIALSSQSVYNNTEQVESTTTVADTTPAPIVGASAGGGAPVYGVPGIVYTQTIYSSPKQSNTNSGIFSGFSIFTKNADVGAKSVEVLNLQKFLNAQGFNVAKKGAGSSGKETLVFGPATRAALARFQKANGIKPAVGYFGPVTRAFVNKMLGK